MVNIQRLITVASWEDRFYLGVQATIERHPTLCKIDMFFYKEYSEWSENNRSKVESMCLDKGILLCTHELSFESPVLNWRIVEIVINADADKLDPLIDITTMPRDTIWAIFYFLQRRVDALSYIYFKPERYNSDWLSRDPSRPRLAFRMSGIARLGIPTLLVIATGFDVERTEQLINFFEPKKIILGIQKGNQFENIQLNLQRHEQIRSAHNDVITLEVDSYSDDHGYGIYANALAEQEPEFNVVLSSLGPKPSSIALYKLAMLHPEMALVYAPSNQFNKEYSWGLGEACEGTFVFHKEE